MDKCKNIFTSCNYIVNDLVKFEGYNFLFSPFSYGTSNNKAFQSATYEKELKTKLNQLYQLDFLVTHGPMNSCVFNSKKINWEVWGHEHSSYGYKHHNIKPNRICTCSMDPNYKISNGPIVLDIKKKLVE